MDPNDPLGLGFPDEDAWVHTGPITERGSVTEPVESFQDEQANMSHFFEEAVGIEDPIDIIRRHIQRLLRSFHRFSPGCKEADVHGAKLDGNEILADNGAAKQQSTTTVQIPSPVDAIDPWPTCGGYRKQGIRRPCKNTPARQTWKKSATQCLDCLANARNAELIASMESRVAVGIDPCSKCYRNDARPRGGLCQECVDMGRNNLELRNEGRGKRKHAHLGQ